MKPEKMTLDEFRLSELRLYPNATGELSNLLREIGLAAKRIYSVISRNGEPGISDNANMRNTSGEIVKPLDRYAHQELLTVLKHSLSCAGIASEEEENILVFDNKGNNNSQYVVMFDPIDGSSNCNNCMTVGTIFGIYRRSTKAGTPCSVKDFLQTGRNLTAAGDIIYGVSTMMVYATKRGVNGFTLDPSIGEFCLSHPSIRCPEAGRIYSVNESNILNFGPAVGQYIKSMQQYNLAYPGFFTARYVGSMVADLHRTLLEGGIFLYPATEDHQDGKLRLMYECNPFAFIFETAGGTAIDGHREILSIAPTDIHQRTPLFIGSRDMVARLSRFIKYENRTGSGYVYES